MFTGILVCSIIIIYYYCVLYCWRVVIVVVVCRYCVDWCCCCCCPRSSSSTSLLLPSSSLCSVLCSLALSLWCCCSTCRTCQRCNRNIRSKQWYSAAAALQRRREIADRPGACKNCLALRCWYVVFLAVSSGLQVSLSLSLSPPFVFLCLWLSGELFFVVVAAGAVFRVWVVFGVCWRCQCRRCQCRRCRRLDFSGAWVFSCFLNYPCCVYYYLLVVVLIFVLLSLLVFLFIIYSLSLLLLL